MTIRSVQPLLSDVSALSRFKGYYCLAGIVTKLDRDGNPYWILTLMDAFDSVDVVARHLENEIKRFVAFGYIHLEAARFNYHGNTFYRADFIIAVDEIPAKYRDVRLIPYKAVVNQQDLNDLVFIIENVKCKVLREFINQTLIQNRVMVPFIRNPASINHHHNYVGGLLHHSVSVAKAFKEAHISCPEERDLGIVGALLHDLGKTQTLTQSLNYTATGTVVNHDFLTLELCAIPLHRLENIKPRYADILRHIWTCNKGHYAYMPKIALAKQIQFFDRNNATL